MTLNLLRPGDNKKSLGFYGGGGFANSAKKYVLYTWPEYAKTIVSALRDFDELKQSPQIDFAAALDLCVLFCFPDKRRILVEYHTCLGVVGVPVDRNNHIECNSQLQN